MPACDLCGKGMERLLRAELEGAELNVCEGCGKYGTLLGKVEEKKEVILPKKKIAVKEEVEERVVFGFSDKLRRIRDKKGMKQEEFAEFLNEKWSVVQKWERGSLKPKIEMARKLEKILGVNLVERIKEGKVELKEVKSGELTLADMIKVRKRG